MPHVIVKLWPGKSEEQKRRLADAISKDVTNILNYGRVSFSSHRRSVVKELGRESL
jgi:4-oxalocrotonate tautomerase